MQRDVGLAEEEEEYAVVHRHREQMPTSIYMREEEAYITVTQAQAEETPVEAGREREKRRIREDFEVASQRLQDVMNSFGTGASLPPLDTNVFGILSPFVVK